MLGGNATPMVIEPLTPERRRQQTRDYLLRAAAQVFAERGFQGASLDEVAAVAGFTKGAVYSNFKNKDDLLLALLEARYEKELAAVQAILARSEGPPEAHLSDFVALLQGRAEGAEEAAALFQEFCLYAMRNPAARDKLVAFDNLDVDSVTAIIAAERARHGIKSSEPAAHAARIVVALTRGVSIMRAVNPEAVDETFLQSLLGFLARALTSASTEPTNITSATPVRRRRR